MHHGIKGMKWGVRRFQKKDGTLTSAGKKRYSDSDSSSGETPKKLNHRQKLEAKYREQGMTQKEAEVAANKRIQTERILAITATATVAAATAYVVNKNIKERTDHIVKSGTKLHVIADTDNKNFDRAFYGAYKDTDRMMYRGMYGKQMQLGGKSKIYDTTLDVHKDVRIASRKAASEAFAELYKNDAEFREAFKRSNAQFNSHGMVPKRDAVIRKASKTMTDKQLKKAGYDAFNIGLVNHDKDGSMISKKFYDKLKAKGYDGIMDINDQKYSGYRTKAPVILFDKRDKISVSDVKQLTDKQLNADFGKAQVRVLAPALAKTGAAYATLYGGLAAVNAAETRKRTSAKVVKNYRKEHPNTKLTDAQIARMFG